MKHSSRSELSRIRESMASFNAKDFLKTGQLPDGVPPEVASFAKEIANASRKHYSAGLLRKQMEFTALQNQINPHFLYNTLEAIRSEALLQNCGDIAQMAEKLARFFRYCISSQETFVALQEELFNLEDYFFIQQYRFGNRYKLNIEVENEDLLSCYFPKLTLQPLAENAIFHGLEQKKGTGTLGVWIRGTDHKIYVTVSDDGVGMEQTQVDEINARLHATGSTPNRPLNQHHGVALVNVSERIRIYFGEEYGLRINSFIGKGTDAELVLPRIDELALSRFQAALDREQESSL